MKRFLSVFLIFTLVFVAVATGFNIICRRLSEKRVTSCNVAVNRINSEITAAYDGKAESCEEFISKHMQGWEKTYGKDAPDSISFIAADEKSGVFRSAAGKNSAVCAVYDSKGDVCGFVEYTYNERVFPEILWLVNGLMVLCYLLMIAVLSYVSFAILKPFRKFSEYPEKLARLRDIQKLPESKSRYFGRYIWGMNMLSDVLAAGGKRINTLEGEHQKLVTSIAHGVKTPLANIKLYTDAVRTGLYSDKGMTEDIADKIDFNAEKIEAMAEELMAASNSSLGGYDIETERFPVNELADLIREEFSDRMALKRIPFNVECTTQAIMESDKYALFRAVSQLLENAVKYGDGSGIHVNIMRQDDGFSISVKDRGVLLPENEIPYVFRSYWRGSNAADVEGSGIGLYVVHETVKALGGSVHARIIDETSEMEFVIYIEN